MKLQVQLAPVTLPVRPGFDLAFNRYVFAVDGRDLYVFFSQTADMTDDSQANSSMTRLSRWQAALAGSRHHGQINLEVALAGPANPDDALQLFRARLPELIAIPPARPGERPSGYGL
jgi:hypothetical protein